MVCVDLGKWLALGRKAITAYVTTFYLLKNDVQHIFLIVI